MAEHHRQVQVPKMVLKGQVKQVSTRKQAFLGIVENFLTTSKLSYGISYASRFSSIVYGHSGD